MIKHRLVILFFLLTAITCYFFSAKAFKWWPHGLAWDVASPVVAESTDDWNTYTHPAIGFSFRYPRKLDIFQPIELDRQLEHDPLQREVVLSMGRSYFLRAKLNVNNIDTSNVLKGAQKVVGEVDANGRTLKYQGIHKRGSFFSPPIRYWQMQEIVNGNNVRFTFYAEENKDYTLLIRTILSTFKFFAPASSTQAGYITHSIPSDWEKYVDASYGLEMRYPSNWQVLHNNPSEIVRLTDRVPMPPISVDLMDNEGFKGLKGLSFTNAIFITATTTLIDGIPLTISGRPVIVKEWDYRKTFGNTQWKEVMILSKPNILITFLSGAAGGTILQERILSSLHVTAPTHVSGQNPNIIDLAVTGYKTLPANPTTGDANVKIFAVVKNFGTVSVQSFDVRAKMRDIDLGSYHGVNIGPGQIQEIELKQLYKLYLTNVRYNPKGDKEYLSLTVKPQEGSDAVSTNDTIFDPIVFGAITSAEPAVVMISPRGGEQIPQGPGNVKLSLNLLNTELLANPSLQVDLIKNGEVLGWIIKSGPGTQAAQFTEHSRWDFSWAPGTYTGVAGYLEQAPPGDFSLRATLRDGNNYVANSITAPFSVVVP